MCQRAHQVCTRQRETLDSGSEKKRDSVCFICHISPEDFCLKSESFNYRYMITFLRKREKKMFFTFGLIGLCH